jgi:hypothetical protein
MTDKLNWLENDDGSCVAHSGAHIYLIEPLPDNYYGWSVRGAATNIRLTWGILRTVEKCKQECERQLKDRIK